MVESPPLSDTDNKIVNQAKEQMGFLTSIVLELQKEYPTLIAELELHNTYKLKTYLYLADPTFEKCMGDAYPTALIGNIAEVIICYYGNKYVLEQRFDFGRQRVPILKGNIKGIDGPANNIPNAEVKEIADKFAELVGFYATPMFTEERYTNSALFRRYTFTTLEDAMPIIIENVVKYIEYGKAVWGDKIDNSNL